MEDTVLIKYKSAQDSDGYDLGLLGESFSGINVVLKQLADMTGIEGEIEIKTSGITQGSIDLHTIFQITTTGVPFHKPQDLLDFLQVANPEMYQQARAFLSGSLGVHNTINDFFARYPFDAMFLTALAGKYAVKALKWAAKQKRTVTTSDSQLGEIPVRKAKRLRAMVVQGKFSKVLKPMTQGNIQTIAAQAGSDEEVVAVAISENDIENYLPEDDQILPQFENGTVHELTGVLHNLQSARGEIIKIKVDGLERRFCLITARPHDGQSTEDYIPYYHQQVTFTAEVVRASMYKRPEFVIQNMDILQQQICTKVRKLIHEADADIVEEIKFTNRPYFTHKGNVCALLAAKQHVNVFIYDPIAVDPNGIINQGHDNQTARSIQISEGSFPDERSFVALIQAVVANNEKGGWRKLRG